MFLWFLGWKAQEEEEESLKYLEFVQVAIIQVLVYFSNIYCLAKDKSGPLKPGVDTVEDTVKSVVGPVYEKFHGVPIEVLKYMDRKVSAFSTLNSPYYIIIVMD